MPRYSSSGPSRWLLLLATVFSILAGGCVTVPIDAETERPALWRVEKPDGSSLWLLGTVHWLPADQQPESWRMEGWLRHRRYIAGQPLPAPWNHGPLHVALQTMDRLVVESVDQPSKTEMLAVAANSFEFDACEAASMVASDSIDDPDAEPAQRIPLAAQLFLVNENRPRPVRDADNIGLEFWLGTVAGLRGIPVFALENLELRARAAEIHLSDKSCDERREVLARLRMLQSEPSEAQPERPRAYLLWSQGEVAALDEELHGFDRDNPELFRALVSGRNRFWIEALMGHIAAPGDVLVAVGMAHLAGPGNLLELLDERGIAARRLQ